MSTVGLWLAAKLQRMTGITSRKHSVGITQASREAFKHFIVIVDH
jgi:hypothetical protein